MEEDFQLKGDILSLFVSCFWWVDFWLWKAGIIQQHTFKVVCLIYLFIYLFIEQEITYRDVKQSDSACYHCLYCTPLKWHSKSKASVFGKLWERQKNIYFSHTLIISKLVWRQSQSFANSRPAQGSLALLHFFVSPWPEHCLYLYHWQSEPHKQT